MPSRPRVPIGRSGQNPAGRGPVRAVRVVAMDADDDRAVPHASDRRPGPPPDTTRPEAPGASWPEQRRQAVAGHAAALEAARTAEATRAAGLLADFVRRAAEAGLPPGPLRAASFDGRSTYRTTLRGWYLKANRSVAVGEDGHYYVLTVPSSLRARFTGADVPPSTPRLVVGAGGGDGETIPLADLLDRRLTAGAVWP